MSDGIVRLTRRQVREVDRRAIEVYGVPGIVLMENAARGAAEVAWEMLGRAPDVIDALRSCRVLAVDLPSGLDCDRGEPLGDCCVRAAKTVTFVAEKAGFANPASRQYTGEVVIADIGCPKEIIDAVLRDV